MLILGIVVIRWITAWNENSEDIGEIELWRDFATSEKLFKMKQFIEPLLTTFNYKNWNELSCKHTILTASFV